jgi:hypothetical protein
MMRKMLVMLVAMTLAGPLGCYNTYNITLDELGKAQEGGDSNAIKVKTEEGEEVVVTENTKLGVTDSGGTYHAVSPFNFTLTRGQLVAPDEDLLLGRDQIETGNVKVVSGTKTALLVAGGVAAIVAGALFITLTAEDRKEFGEE